MKNNEEEELNSPAASGNEVGKRSPVRTRPQNTEQKKALAEPKRKRARVKDSVVPALVKSAVYLVSVIVISLFLGFFAISVANDVFAFVKSTDEVSVSIPENATVEDVADILGENGIIRYPKIFTMFAALKKDDGKFIAGEYQVTPSTNYEMLLSAFKYRFVRTVVRLTIPEGYCCEEIIDLFVSNGIGTRESFIDAINNTDYSEFRFVRELEEQGITDRYYRLEGYLYPDTYDFYSDATAAQVVYKLLSNFDRKFKEVYYDRAKEIGLTVDQVVTIASLIQEEAYYLEDFENVASVFHNRLNNPSAFPHIESDATVAYAIHVETGTRPTTITPADLEFKSKYNTYLVDGLCPGPISCPGYDAIVTAMYPAKTNYYYFYTKQDKHTVFSKTYAEHQAAIAADVSLPS